MKSFSQTPEKTRDFLELLEKDRGNVERVIEEIEESSVRAEFRIHARADTVEDSVRHSGFDRKQIVKTLIFRGEEYFAVMAPGDRRVDTDRMEDLRDSSVEMASPEKVEEITGYIIGSVSPFDLEIDLYMDSSILEHETVRPAGGSRVIGVEIAPDDLRDISGAITGDFTE